VAQLLSFNVSACGVVGVLVELTAIRYLGFSGSIAQLSDSLPGAQRRRSLSNMGTLEMVGALGEKQCLSPLRGVAAEGVSGDLKVPRFGRFETA
jgi:hypothetical protein